MMVLAGPSTFRTLHHRRLAEGVVEELVGRIRRGEFPPGARLPSERSLVETLGVSRAVIREALVYMQQAGIVHTRQGAGSFVSAGLGVPDAGEAAAELQDLFELRMAVETEAAALAALRSTDGDRQRMAAALERFDAAAAHARLGVEADFDFHHAVVQASHNRYFVHALAGLTEALLRSVFLSRIRSIAVEGRSRMVQREHRAVFERIMAGDADGARAAMRRHLEAARQRLTG